jgi:hypothetical protein
MERSAVKDTVRLAIQGIAAMDGSGVAFRVASGLATDHQQLRGETTGLSSLQSFIDSIRRLGGDDLFLGNFFSS